MLHALLLFLDILGGVGLFIGGACELVGLRLLLKAHHIESMRLATTITRLALVIDPVSSMLVAATGLYFVVTAWGWSVAWIDVALASFALITFSAPALKGRRFLAIHRLVAREPNGGVPDALNDLIRDPVLGVSVYSVLPLATGLLALMMLKPSLFGALLIMSFALVLGVMSGLLLTVSTRRRANLAASSLLAQQAPRAFSRRAGRDRIQQDTR